MEKAAKVIAALRCYVDETFQDSPPASASKGFVEDYFSDAAFFCAFTGRNYGWSMEETMSCPIKILFQCLNEAKRNANSRVPLCNPSDRVKSAWMRDINTRRTRGH
jgi:hypothetical protein